MKNRLLYFWILFLGNLPLSLVAQDLIANGGFEYYKKCPKELGVFTVKQWNSIARSGTPDLYTQCVPNGKEGSPNWQFCMVRPYAGASFTGIITHFHKESYREYIYTKLTSPLLKDSLYEFKIALSISQMARFKQKYIDVVFSEESKLTFAPKPIIDTLPSMTFCLDSLSTDGKWMVYTGYYIANGEERFVNIGNFHASKNNPIEKISKRSDKMHRKIYNSAYICMDEVSLKKIPLKNSYVTDYSNCTEKGLVLADDFDFESLQLENSTFESDILYSIAKFLISNPNNKLLIKSYTDNQGDFNENKLISFNRGKLIAQYLAKKGVAENQIEVIGFGSEFPIASNSSAEGRAKNFRVEMRLTQSKGK
ncbi:MAG: OmpA family protein [Fluviicola sp.]